MNLLEDINKKDKLLLEKKFEPLFDFKSNVTNKVFLVHIFHP